LRKSSNGSGGISKIKNLRENNRRFGSWIKMC